MNVASFDLCKELYELSGWENGEWSGPTPWSKHQDEWSPTYDLGFLLRKLQPYEPTVTYFDGSKPHTEPEHKDRWVALLSESFNTAVADTPEDAAAKLCIELFTQHILQKN